MNEPLNALRRRLSGGALAGALLLATGMAGAQTWPEKPIRLVVGAPPGGTVDVAARGLAERLTALLGQTVLVENKPGAAGLLGLQDLLKSPRDGYTFMVTLNGLLSEVPHVVKTPVDPFKVLRPVAELGRTGLVFVGNAQQVPGADLKGALAWAKAQGNKISYASYSAGSVSHTLGQGLNKLAALDMVHVPYKGSPPALQDLVGGQVHFMFDGPGNVASFVKAGKLKVFATTSPTRLVLMPEVPTFAELGYRDLTEVVWVGLWTTPDMAGDIQARMREATTRALQDPKLRELLANLGMGPASNATPDELMAQLRAASDKQAATLQAIGFKPD